MRLVVGRSVAFRLASCIGLAVILVSGSSLAQRCSKGSAYLWTRASS